MAARVPFISSTMSSTSRRRCSAGMPLLMPPPPTNHSQCQCNCTHNLSDFKRHSTYIGTLSKCALGWAALESSSSCLEP
eukprot:3111245-Amphidinium_carterae.1